MYEPDDFHWWDLSCREPDRSASEVVVSQISAGLLLSLANKNAGVLLASSRFTSSVLLSTEVADVSQKRRKITKRETATAIRS